MIVILVLVGRAIAALVKYLRKQKKENLRDYTINRLITEADFEAIDARSRAELAA